MVFLMCKDTCTNDNLILLRCWSRDMSQLNVVVIFMLCAMQEGEVAEQGTHSELIALQGIYADMWSQQELGARGEATSSSERSSTEELQQQKA